jgi:hypothetical protein
MTGKPSLMLFFNPKVADHCRPGCQARAKAMQLMVDQCEDWKKPSKNAPGPPSVSQSDMVWAEWHKLATKHCEEGESPGQDWAPAALVTKESVVPEARLELASLAAEDFESPASTIPPLGPPTTV